MSSYINAEQYEVLMHPRGIHKDRVSQRDGHAYVEVHDIKAELIRVFGFERWSWQINDYKIQRETEVITKSTQQPAWYISALVQGTLTVCAPDGTVLATYDGLHAGSSTHPKYGEALGNAVANADSYALKRAAICALGTQGGLGLYNGGSRAEIVRWTVVKPEGVEDAKKANPEDTPVITPESLEQPPAGPDPRTTSSAANPPAAAETETAAAPSVPAAAVSPDPDEKAQEIRTLALGEMPAEFSQPGKWINHLMGLAVKAKVQRHPVAALYSAQKVELRVLLEDRMKELISQARAAGARERAS